MSFFKSFLTGKAGKFLDPLGIAGSVLKSKAGKLIDPLDLSGARSDMKKDAQSKMQADGAAAQLKKDADAKLLENEKALLIKKTAEDLQLAQEESRRQAMSSFLTGEGADTGRRKFLTAAK